MGREQISSIYPNFIDLADKKKEVYDEDLLALLQESRSVEGENYYYLEFMQVTSSTTTQPAATASVILKVGDEINSEVGHGNGPVDSVINAISKIVGIECKLVDFNVSSVTRGRDAMAEVYITVEFDENLQIAGHSSSPDTIEAGAKAFLSAVNKYTLARNIKKQKNKKFNKKT